MLFKNFPKLSRRDLLTFGLSITALLAFGKLGWSRLFPSTPEIPGSIKGASSKIGHLIRKKNNQPAHDEKRVKTLIIGGGIAGLSAAWWLNKHGYQDFLLLELEPEAGGNSSSGQNPISAYPWGAHYIPVPGPDASFVKTLFEELEIIKDYNRDGLPVLDEYFLCADPHERLLFQGKWQEGIIPSHGIPEEDREQIDQFFDLMEEYKQLKGKDNRYAFTIPVDLSSRDPEFLALDKNSFRHFILSKGWSSKYLHWYLNYCCRDDYGTPYDQISAWAGIHYFASRKGEAANAENNAIVTWPEGNGWIVNKIKEKFPNKILENRLAFSIKSEPNQIATEALNIKDQKVTRYISENVIFAVPRFIASRVIRDSSSSLATNPDEFHYAPWLVANISLTSLPQGNGKPVAWDNVSFYSKSLGYIVATHQNLSPFPKSTVLTYYLPLDHTDPVTARKEALEKSHREWTIEILKDLEKMHPGIGDSIAHLDVWVWGHGMIAPIPGFMWGKTRKQMEESLGNIHFAHSDMSGISIFEEAQYRGVMAAKKVLDKTSSSKSQSI